MKSKNWGRVTLFAPFSSLRGTSPPLSLSLRGFLNLETLCRCIQWFYWYHHQYQLHFSVKKVLPKKSKSAVLPKLWAEGQKLGALAFTQFFFANRARAFYVWFYLAIFACWKSLKAILFQYIQKVQLESVWFQLFIFSIPSMLKLKSYQPKTIIILSLSSLQCTNVATQWLCVAY